MSLCDKASWLKIKFECADPLGNQVINIVNKACTLSALLLDINYEVDIDGLEERIITILKNQHAAKDRFESLLALVAVVKEWLW